MIIRRATVATLALLFLGGCSSSEAFAGAETMPRAGEHGATQIPCEEALYLDYAMFAPDSRGFNETVECWTGPIPLDGTDVLDAVVQGALATPGSFEAPYLCPSSEELGDPAVRCAVVVYEEPPNLVLLRVYAISPVEPDNLADLIATANDAEAVELLLEIMVAEYAVRLQSVPPK